MIAAVGGILTIAVIALAFAGAVLAFTGAPSARNVLVAAALAGLVTAMPLWVPAAVVIGAAASSLASRRLHDYRAPPSRTASASFNETVFS